MKNHIAGDPANFATNSFTDYASAVSPIDEAKMFPQLYQSITNSMPDGLCKTILAQPGAAAAVIDNSHRRFMHRTHEYATDCQDDLRIEMRDHLCYQMRDALFEQKTWQPNSGFGRFMLAVIDRLWPDFREARQQAAADLLVEQMACKAIMVKLAVMSSMFTHVDKTTVAASSKKRAA